MGYINMIRKALADITLMYMCLKMLELVGCDTSRPSCLLYYIPMCLGLGWITEKLDKIK